MRKIVFTVMLALLFITTTVGLYAANMIDLIKASGSGPVTHRGTNISVTIPDTYEMKDTDFRAVWISTMTGDVARYTSKEQYIAEMESVFEVMEYYNLNAMIFHVRIYNDALYNSDLNKRSPYYSTVNFEEWDPLAWLIEESHKRGIEFHAWMNPYRVKNGYSGTLEQYAATEPSTNIASKPEYLIKNSSNSIILNPGEPAVRDFIVDTVIEFLERYDADAIHFDDYFYVSNVDDYSTRVKYNTDNLSLDDFRRKQVDLFIKQLYDSMKDFNRRNGRVVQLGISPSGIYNNGSYVDPSNYQYDANGTLTYPLYSNTSGMAHYGNYLFSDTKKWVDNEWIDYILPQSYWAFEHPSAGFADVMDWWAAVVKNKKVNLYSGMGLYMINSNAYSWNTNPEEALNQVKYSVKHPEIQGYSIYSYKHIEAAYNSSGNALFNQNFTKVKEEAWTNKALLPEIRTYQSIKLGQVNSLNVEKINYNTLTFNALDRAKFYVIYRSVDELTLSPDEIIDVIYNTSSEIIYEDIDGGNQSYNYAVRPMSITNTLGEAVIVNSNVNRHLVTFKGFNGEVLSSNYVDDSTSATSPNPPSIEGYNFVGWDKDFTSITEETVINAVYEPITYTITFIDGDNVIDTRIVNHGDTLVLDDPVKEGYSFIGYGQSLKNITRDLTVIVYFIPITYEVIFVDLDGTVVSTQEVTYKTSATAPVIDRTGFVGWDQTFSEVTSNLEIKAVYDNVYLISFVVEGEVIKTEFSSDNFTLPIIPTKDGHDKLSPVWNITDYSSLNEDTVVEAIYTKNTYNVIFKGLNGEVLKEEIVDWKNSATAPQITPNEGYEFDKWDKDFSEVTSDLEVNALYIEVVSDNTVSCAGFSFETAIVSLSVILYIVFRKRK